MTNKLYLLDTNIISFLIREKSETIRTKLKTIPMSNVCISSITHAELLYGLARKPDATRLHKLVHEFLMTIETVAWDVATAEAYAALRVACEKKGLALGNMDMLIAAHAMAESAILVSNDSAFLNIDQLIQVEDWSKE